MPPSQLHPPVRAVDLNSLYTSHTDEGVEGFGLGQSSPGVRQVIEHGMKDLLIGQDPFNIRKAVERTCSGACADTDAKESHSVRLSAVDIGLWDLKAKALGLPLYKLLGPYQESVPIYGSGGWTNFTVDELIAEATEWVEQGIKRVKIKVGKDFGTSERRRHRTCSDCPKSSG